MQKLTTIFLTAFIALLFAGCTPKITDAAVPGGTDWVARAAAYKKNPEALRQLVEDCEATEKQLMTARQQLDQYRSQSGSEGAALTAAQNATAAAQAEAAALRSQMAILQADAAATANDRLDTDLAVVSGIIFQVQLGAFAQNTVDPNLSTGNALELDNQNGLQKFVVSQFRTYKNAEVLKNRLVKMGVKDAFIIAKNNGARITVPEALRLTGQQ